MSRIAYFGPEGTFTEAALMRMVDAGLIPGGGTAEMVPIEGAAATLQAVRDGAADYACVPIENSIDGSILPTLDSLATGAPLQIHGELTLDVAFSIATRPGVTTTAVRSVAGYPVAVAQVHRWLEEHLPSAEIVPANSNAAAALDVVNGRADAAITTALAAGRYGLDELATGVIDEPNARTRFVLAGPPGRPPRRTGADRTSVVLRIANIPGALVAAMSEFGIRDIDLTRIESRPTRTELGTYVFFLDCAGHIDDDAVAEALKALRRRCSDVRYLGSWPTGSPAGALPPNLGEATDWLAGLRGGESPR